MLYHILGTSQALGANFGKVQWWTSPKYIYSGYVVWNWTLEVTKERSHFRYEIVVVRLTAVSHSNGSVCFCVLSFLGPLPSTERPRWPRSGPVELSRMQERTLDLIWSLMWTHREPQLDLILPQHATTEVPNTVSHYISSYFPNKISTIRQSIMYSFERWPALKSGSLTWLIASAGCKKSGICKQWALI